MDTLQPIFSAIQRSVATAELPWCHAHETGVIVYSPMQFGLLTGRFSVERAKALSKDDWRSRNAEFTEEKLARNLQLADARVWGWDFTYRNAPYYFPEMTEPRVSHGQFPASRGSYHRHPVPVSESARREFGGESGPIHRATPRTAGG